MRQGRSNVLGARWLLAALCVVAAQPAVAQENVVEWAKERVRDQKRAVAVRLDGGEWFNEHVAPPLPNFVPPTSLAPLVKAVRPGVVNLSTHNDSGAARSLGSGFIISADGLLVTNNHVVERAQEIKVRLADGRELSASVVGKDPSTDLALLRLSGAGVGKLPTVALGDSDGLEVGDWVVAIGNPFGLDTSVTHGIISARERVIGVGPFDDFIQTNALINPGNSGGPLFNMRGEVVGVCTAIVQQAQGIGFAVPINLVKELLPHLLVNGRLERGWLGVNIQELSGSGGRAAMVLDVVAGSPAAKVGLKPGDKVTAVGGKPVESYLQLLRRIALAVPGSTVKLSLQRAGKPLDIEVTLAHRPSDEAMQVLATAGRIDALGVLVKEVPAEAQKQMGGEPGVLVAAVVPGGAAELAGLQANDLILEVNRQRVADVRSFKAALSAGGESSALVKYRRDDVARYVTVRRE